MSTNYQVASHFYEANVKRHQPPSKNCPRALLPSTVPVTEESFVLPPCWKTEGHHKTTCFPVFIGKLEQKCFTWRRNVVVDRCSQKSADFKS